MLKLKKKKIGKLKPKLDRALKQIFKIFFSALSW